MESRSDTLIACQADRGLKLPRLTERHAGQVAMAWFRTAESRTWHLCGVGAKGEPLTAELLRDSADRPYVFIRAASQADLLGDRA
jgi:hypothetical protein